MIRTIEKYECINCGEKKADYEYLPCWDCKDEEYNRRQMDRDFDEIYKKVINKKRR